MEEAAPPFAGFEGWEHEPQRFAPRDRRQGPSRIEVNASHPPPTLVQDGYSDCCIDVLDKDCVKGLAASAPVAWTVPSLIAPRESIGTLAGMVNLCGQIAAISAPVVTGYIVLFLGIVGYLFLLGRIEAIAEPQIMDSAR
jgi:hypothetical protein